MAALLLSGNTAAIFVCHGWIPRMPRLLSSHVYLDTSPLMRRARIVSFAKKGSRKIVSGYNSILSTLSGSTPRRALPAKPKRALIFSNNSQRENLRPNNQGSLQAIQNCELTIWPITISRHTGLRCSNCQRFECAACLGKNEIELPKMSRLSLPSGILPGHVERNSGLPASFLDYWDEGFLAGVVAENQCAFWLRRQKRARREPEQGRQN